jgi:hypothetical protein
LDTTELLEVPTDTGRFIKLGERLDECHLNGQFIKLMDDGKSLTVISEGGHESFHPRNNWCCLLPVTEIELKGPGDNWLSYEEIFQMLPGFAPGTRYQVSIGEGDPYLLTIAGYSPHSSGVVQHRFFADQWRFRKQDDKPVIYVPRTKEEVVKYVRIFF